MFGFIEDTFDWVCDNPGKSLLVLGAGLATGGAAWAFAGPIAATIGSTGALAATATTGAEIATLAGAALESASLAAIGGGAMSVGGGGVALGTTVIAQTGFITGVGAATGIVTCFDESERVRVTGEITRLATPTVADASLFRHL